MSTFPVAAILWLFLAGQPTQPPSAHAGVVVEDRSPLVGAKGITTDTLGVEAAGGAFTQLIYAGARVPTSRTELFSAAADGQTEISLAVFRGKGKAHPLGRFRVVGASGAKRGVPQIEVTFSVVGRQILVAARDLATGAELRIEREGA
jgi:molecular chaperone DnaK